VHKNQLFEFTLQVSLECRDILLLSLVALAREQPAKSLNTKPQYNSVSSSSDASFFARKHTVYIMNLHLAVGGRDIILVVRRVVLIYTVYRSVLSRATKKYDLRFSNLNRVFQDGFHWLRITK
jgi:hypothetical protein